MAESRKNRVSPRLEFENTFRQTRATYSLNTVLVIRILNLDIVPGVGNDATRGRAIGDASITIVVDLKVVIPNNAFVVLSIDTGRG